MIGPFNGQYGFLSNFYVEPARSMLSNEHFFQAEKSLDPEERAFVMRANGPVQAKQRGRMITLREDWDQVKNQVMLSGLRNKFYLDVSLRDRLLATGDEFLAEVNTWGDTYWGIVRDRDQPPIPDIVNYTGDNYLGRLLMEVRAELQDTMNRNEES